MFQNGLDISGGLTTRNVRCRCSKVVEILFGKCLTRAKILVGGYNWDTHRICSEEVGIVVALKGSIFIMWFNWFHKSSCYSIGFSSPDVICWKPFIYNFH